MAEWKDMGIDEKLRAVEEEITTLDRDRDQARANIREEEELIRETLILLGRLVAARERSRTWTTLGRTFRKEENSGLKSAWKMKRELEDALVRLQNGKEEITRKHTLYRKQFEEMRQALKKKRG